MPSRILIYGLISPLDNRLFYIGQTKRRREFRLIEHIEEAVKGTKTPVYNEIRRYMFQGVIPHIFVIEKVSNIQMASERELYWINWFWNSKNYELPIDWQPQTPKSKIVRIDNIGLANVRR